MKDIETYKDYKIQLKLFFIIIVLSCIINIVLITSLIKSRAKYLDLRKEIIKHGYAEYIIVDGNNGLTEFRWKTINEHK